MGVVGQLFHCCRNRSQFLLLCLNLLQQSLLICRKLLYQVVVISRLFLSVLQDRCFLLSVFLFVPVARPPAKSYPFEVFFNSLSAVDFSIARKAAFFSSSFFFASSSFFLLFFATELALDLVQIGKDLNLFSLQTLHFSQFCNVACVKGFLRSKALSDPCSKVSRGGERFISVVVKFRMATFMSER